MRSGGVKRALLVRGVLDERGYRPGAYLTLRAWQREYNEAHAMGSEQCDGREAAVVG